MNLDFSPVYDIETLPNCFTLHMELFGFDQSSTWEISEFRDDRRQLLAWFEYLRINNIPMIGFNNINFDYPVIHFIWKNPNCTVQQIYECAMNIINSIDKFGHIIWERDRFAPQIDLFKINHFDNKAKSTSLKALQINMRMSNVVEMPLPFGVDISNFNIDQILIPYNKWDVKSTKKFAKYCKTAIDFRIAHMDQFGYDVLNYNDSKLGSKILEKRLGEELLFEKKWIDTDFNGGGYFKRCMRQTIRHKIVLSEIIFPFIRFNQPEFKRVHEYMLSQTLTPDEFSDLETVSTKGVFAGLKAVIDGLEFKFGTGGIHGSIERKRLIATDDWLIRDIDVASLYPSIAIVNDLAPEHLGHRFVEEYANLPKERKEWQKKKGKKCVEANSLKLAGNGTYGNSNNIFSPFYDPQYTMTITINGQLMLAMLAEWLMTVPTLKIIQINTDGITYYIHKDYDQYAKQYCKEWEKLTKLTLEDTSYKRMFIRDVNSYVAESFDGSLKQKGAYWHPDPLNYAKSISEAQPPAWHKDLGNIVSIRAAVAAMIYGIDPSTYIRIHTDPYDFMLRIKVNRSDNLLWNNQQIQKTSRYYVSTDGSDLVKVAPPPKGAVIGTYKRANGIPEWQWQQVNAELQACGCADQWDGRIHTKNKSKHENRETKIQAGYKTTICNNVDDFRFDNIDYNWYIEEARKLIIE